VLHRRTNIPDKILRNIFRGNMIWCVGGPQFTRQTDGRPYVMRDQQADKAVNLPFGKDKDGKKTWKRE
jgi:hypothetical protein